jgi:hypothetical protein
VRRLRTAFCLARRPLVSTLYDCMNKNTHIETCFLCHSPARWVETRLGNRRHYQCSSDACGEFEVSLPAMTQLEDNLAFKRTASAIAARLVDPGKILEIKMTEGLDAQPEVQVVKRRPDLGGAL